MSRGFFSSNPGPARLNGATFLVDQSDEVCRVVRSRDLKGSFDA